MTWELCDGSSQYLVDLWGNGSASWQAAKKHFKEKGYYGEFLLIHRSRNGNFKLYRINIKENNNDQ
jgi:hypothetical protein